MLARFGHLRCIAAAENLPLSCIRGLAAASGEPTGAQTAAVGAGLIEMRDYTIKPEHFSNYIDLGGVAAEVRTKNMPFMGMYTPETGSVLNRIVHFYAYESLDERDRTRKRMLEKQQWTDFLQRSRPYVLGPQKSMLMKEAASLYSALDMKPTVYFTPPDDNIKGMYELREYQLEAGYSTMGTVVDLLAKGLPHKVGAMRNAGIQCVPVMFGYVEIGTLNKFVEMWRHPSSQGCLDARAASRDSAEWQNAVNAIAPHVQSFRTELMRPVWYSPWQ